MKYPGIEEKINELPAKKDSDAATIKNYESAQTSLAKPELEDVAYIVARPSVGRLFKPIVTSRATNPYDGEYRDIHRPAFVEQMMLKFGSYALLFAGPYLRLIFMAATFPALKGNIWNWTDGAWVAACVASALFLFNDLYIWRGGHSFFVWILLSSFLIMGIWINLEGFSNLLGVKDLKLDVSGVFILMISVGTSILPKLYLTWASPNPTKVTFSQPTSY